MKQIPRTPANVEGPFYVQADQCTACGAPEAEAPALIRFDDVHQSCFFYRQPADAEDTYRAISAVAVCCVRALRYGGSDPDILRRLARLHLVSQCDSSTRAQSVEPLSIVTFSDAAHPADTKSRLIGVSETVATALAAVAPHLTVSTPEAPADADVISFSYSWTSSVPGHDVAVSSADDGTARWCVTVTREGAPLLDWAGGSIDDALRTIREFKDRRWYSPREWAGSRKWEPYPL
jgi:hypothetical protein